jgi:hypothetical protein
MDKVTIEAKLLDRPGLDSQGLFHGPQRNQRLSMDFIQHLCQARADGGHPADNPFESCSILDPASGV